MVSVLIGEMLTLAFKSIGKSLFTKKKKVIRGQKVISDVD